MYLVFSGLPIYLWANQSLKKLIMKKLFIRKILFLSMISVNMLLLTTSCSSDDNDDYIPGGSGGTTELKSNYFTVSANGKNYVYSNNSSAQPTSPGNGFSVATFSSAGSDFDNDYGIYNMGSLTVSYTLQGEGTYSLVSDEELAAVIIAENNEKVISIHAVLGADGAALYETIRSFGGTAQVTIKDGKYHFSIENPAILKKSVSMGENGAQMPENVELKMKDVYVR